MGLVTTANLIEIKDWTGTEGLKKIIDDNSSFKYDHADKYDINQRIVIVRQSSNISYFHTMPIPSDDFTDYENNYLPYENTGSNDTINVTTNLSIGEFDRLRISIPRSLFDSKFIFNEKILFWAEKLTGNASGLYYPNTSAHKLTCTTTDGDKATYQTKEHFIHQPGKTIILFIEGILGVPKENVEQRMGFFDDDDGIFLEQTNSNLQLVHRTSTSGSVVDETVIQSNWNLDTIDGNGFSQINLDPSKIHGFLLSMVSGGSIRFGVFTDDVVIYIHEYTEFNSRLVPFFSNPNLPIRYEIENVGTAASSTDLICHGGTVVSEGGYNPTGVERSATTGLNYVTIGSSSYEPIVSLRLKSDYIKAQIIPRIFNAYNNSNNMAHCKMILGGTLTGGSWLSAGANSITEYNISATGLSGGEFLSDVWLSSQGNNKNQLSSQMERTLLKILTDLDGVSDIMTVIGQSDGSTSQMYATMTFEEIY